jgi:hypothetical protein
MTSGFGLGDVTVNLDLNAAGGERTLIITRKDY